jgi:hypothetical protein
MMKRENQFADEDSQPSARNSDLILLIGLIALIVFVAVVAILIIIDTNGLYYPGWEPGKMHPFLNQLT